MEIRPKVTGKTIQIYSEAEKVVKEPSSKEITAEEAVR